MGNVNMRQKRDNRSGEKAKRVRAIWKTLDDLATHQILRRKQSFNSKLPITYGSTNREEVIEKSESVWR